MSSDLIVSYYLMPSIINPKKLPWTIEVRITKPEMKLQTVETAIYISYTYTIIMQVKQKRIAYTHTHH